MSRVVPSLLAEVEDKADITIETPSAKNIKKHVKLGDRVSYVAKDGKYRTGGFIVSLADDGSSMVILGGKLRWTLKASNIEQIFIVSKK